MVDSLKKVVASAPEDSNKVNTLIKLSDNYRSTSQDSAMNYANEAKALGEKINYRKGTGYALKAIGMVYNLREDYVNALQVWKEALKIFEEDSFKVGAANMLNNIGVIYYNKGLEDNALESYLKSLKYAEEANDPLRIATAMSNVGGVYSNKEATLEKALEYQRNALLISSSIPDTVLMGNGNANIGELYVSIYKRDSINIHNPDSIKLNKRDSTDIKRLDAQNLQQLDSALFYLMKARNFYIGSEDLPFAFNTIGKVYRLKKDYRLSIEYYQKGYHSAEGFDSKRDMGQAKLGIANTKRESGDIKSAIADYKEAEELLKNIGLEDSYDLVEVYEGLSASYSELKDYSNAFKYQTLLINLRKKIYDYEIDKKMANKLFTYNIDKKQGEVNLQKEIVSRQKLIRNGFIGGFAVVLLFAGVFLSQRNRISKEKKRSDELLLNILPAETAEELKATGTAKAKSFDIVSVLFTDFKNFTQASELLSPADLVAEINHCYSEFDKIITHHGIEKIKTIGDAYMCAGGLPATNTTNPVDVVKAGLEMVAFIEKNKQERISKGQPYFELRCGIHTGPVVAGIVGIKKFAYDIWGDTVNTASRMESSGEIGKVNISGATYELVKDHFDCTYRGKVKAKNKGEIDMYFVNRSLS